MIRCIERMGDQCANMAKLVPLSGYEAPKDKTILELIEKMGISVRQQVLQTRTRFQTRHVSLARDLVRQDDEVNRLNREIFQRAVEVGDDAEHARVGDVHGARRALPGADRRQHRRHRRADRVRRDRPVPRVRREPTTTHAVSRPMRD